MNKFFPIVFKIASDGLFIDYTGIEYSQYTGSKVISINETPIDSLLARINKVSPSENKYGSLLALCNRIANQRYAAAFLDKTSPVTLTLQDLNNDSIRHIAVSYNENPVWERGTSKFKTNNDNNLLYGELLEDNPSVAYFIWNGMVSREVLESMKPTSPEYQNILNWALNLTGIKQTENRKSAITEIPELYKSFAQLLHQMKEQKSEYLIIDLRQNSGGMTPLCMPLLYMLYGDKYLNYESKAQYNRRLSPLLLHKWNIRDIDEYNRLKNTNYVPGDYIFSSFSASYDNQTLDEKRKNLSLISYKGGIGKEHTENLNGKPIYEPHVIALCSPRTFSAAYHFLYYLKEIGNITIVGVPSAQAGNAFMETTNFELPHTKIKGSISNAVQLMFPDDKEKGKVFTPDFSMKWADFAKYDFDKNAEVLFCLDLIKKGRIKTK